MKRSLALLASFLVLITLATTLGIAQANTPHETTDITTSTPTATATETDTETTTATTTTTATQTETTTPTVTSTATTDPCQTRPAAPTLVRPADGAIFNRTQITLRWNPVACAAKYRFVVRAGSRNGPIADAGKTKRLRKTTQSLGRGSWYYWSVKACITGHGCAQSVTRRFRLPAPPTPIPTTPAPTGQPTAPANGTPVPGVPPGNLLNTNACGTPPYPCRGVYLSNDSSARWYFNCSWKWVPYGGTVFTTSLWFYPNEGVSLTVVDFNKGLPTETHHYTANSSGYLEVSLDTSGWVQDHYHLLFDGDKSGVEYCGHFDLALTVASPVEHPAHTQAEWDEFYRRLNSSPH